MRTYRPHRCSLAGILSCLRGKPLLAVVSACTAETRRMPHALPARAFLYGLTSCACCGRRERAWLSHRRTISPICIISKWQNTITIRCVPLFWRPFVCNLAARMSAGTMEQVLSFLYGASGITATALYLPQILKYRRDRAARRSIALLSWGGWIVIAAVTVLYALYVVKSYLFAAVAGLNAAAQLTVLYYGLRERFAQPSPPLSPTASA